MKPKIIFKMWAFESCKKWNGKELYMEPLDCQYRWLKFNSDHTWPVIGIYRSN